MSDAHHRQRLSRPRADPAQVSDVVREPLGVGLVVHLLLRHQCGLLRQPPFEVRHEHVVALLDATKQAAMSFEVSCEFDSANVTPRSSGCGPQRHGSKACMSKVSGWSR